MHVQTGTTVECKRSLFLSNRADVGGAVSVHDGSFEGESLNFSRNAVYEGGVGGAAAVEVSKGKNIPFLTIVNNQKILFQCDMCDFERNNGSLAGGLFTSTTHSFLRVVCIGALHVHDMDPGSTFQNDNDLMIDGCKRGGEGEFHDEDHDLTCLTYWVFIGMVNNRATRFRRTRFIENTARAGGAIFSNNLSKIAVVPEVDRLLNENVTYKLDYVLTKNKTQHLEACGVSFHENSVVEGGYGENVASTPLKAFLINRDGEGARLPEKTFTNSSFLSGDRLRFDVKFRDGLDEPVTFAESLMARISCDEETSKKQSAECSKLEISEQETAQASKDGVMKFRAVRLRGLRKRTYTLRIDYRSTSELQTLNVDPSFIQVTMRSCKIGERTVSEEGDYLECQECGQGEFQPFPDRHECLPCNEVENHTLCDGQTIVPRDGYWHATSFSFAAKECIGHDACRSSKKDGKTRTDRLREAAREAHERGEFLPHNFRQNSTLCRKVRRTISSSQSHIVVGVQGYRGVLCGSCEDGYGREGSVCRRCGSPAMRAFVLTMLILWSFLFLTYFLRSVLLLATRIEFNKRFSQARTVQMRQRATNSPPSTSQSAVQGVRNQTPRTDLEMASASSFPEIAELSFREAWMPAASDLQNRRGQESDVMGNSTMTLAERLNRLRPSMRRRRQDGSASTRRRRRFRKGGRLAQKLQTLLNPTTSSVDIEPLTLANPISEIIKVYLPVLSDPSDLKTGFACTSDSCQLPPSDVRCAFDQYRLGRLSEKDTLRNGYVSNQPRKLSLLLSNLGAIGNFSSGTGYLSLDCYLDESSHPKSLRRLTIAILYPLLMFTVYVFIWAGYSLVRRRGTRYILSSCRAKDHLAVLQLLRSEDSVDVPGHQLLHLHRHDQEPAPLLRLYARQRRQGGRRLAPLRLGRRHRCRVLRGTPRLTHRNPCPSSPSRRLLWVSRGDPRHPEAQQEPTQQGRIRQDLRVSLQSLRQILLGSDRYAAQGSDRRHRGVRLPSRFRSPRPHVRLGDRHRPLCASGGAAFHTRHSATELPGDVFPRSNHRCFRCRTHDERRDSWPWGSCLPQCGCDLLRLLHSSVHPGAAGVRHRRVHRHEAHRSESYGDPRGHRRASLRKGALPASALRSESHQGHQSALPTADNPSAPSQRNRRHSRYVCPNSVQYTWRLTAPTTSAESASRLRSCAKVSDGCTFVFLDSFYRRVEET